MAKKTATKKTAVKKTATKKTATKKTTTTKKVISGKSIGRNVIVNIEGVTHSKAFKVKEDRLHILGLVEAYNKRNSKKRLDEIINILSKNKTSIEKKTKEVATKKEVKKAVAPKTSKVPTKQELEAAEALLKKHSFGAYAEKEKSVAKPRKRYGREY